MIRKLINISVLSFTISLGIGPVTADDTLAVAPNYKAMHDDCVLSKKPDEFCKGFRLGVEWYKKQTADTLTRQQNFNPALRVFSGGSDNSGGILSRKMDSHNKIIRTFNIRKYTNDPLGSGGALR